MKVGEVGAVAGLPTEYSDFYKDTQILRVEVIFTGDSLRHLVYPRGQESAKGVF